MYQMDEIRKLVSAISTSVLKGCVETIFENFLAISRLLSQVEICETRE
jgi:hypothetical protein